MYPYKATTKLITDLSIQFQAQFDDAYDSASEFPYKVSFKANGVIVSISDAETNRQSTRMVLRRGQYFYQYRIIVQRPPCFNKKQRTNYQILVQVKPPKRISHVGLQSATRETTMIAFHRNNYSMHTDVCDRWTFFDTVTDFGSNIRQVQVAQLPMPCTQRLLFCNSYVHDSTDLADTTCF